MKRTVYLICLLIIFTTPLWGYEPPAGGEELYHLSSPYFLAGGAGASSTDSPYSDTYNPAASGNTQRTTLDLSYIALARFTAPAQYSGTVLNLGASFPSRVGVFSGSLHFLSSQTDLPLGTLGSVRFSFSKDLYPTLLIGGGLNLTLGKNNNFDWGLAADLGFIHLPGDLGFFKDFRWGFAMQNMGKWYAPLGAPYPSPFTPALGIGFTLVDSKDVDLSFHTDVQFPSFQNVRADIGGELALFDTVGLHVSGIIDLQSLLGNYEPRSFPISGGISFNIKTDIPEEEGYITERGWNRSEINPVVSFTPLQNDVFGLGAGVNLPLGQIDKNPPEITVEYPQLQYISPNNDGESDNLIVPIEIEDERFIKGYNLKMYNEGGELVQEIKNKEKRPETQSFKNIIARLVYKKTGIEIPEQLRWDGTAKPDFTITDGKYSFVLEAWDDNGNVGKTDPFTVVVDNTAPDLTLEEISDERKIFSPNGDGNKDTLPIEQEGSKEDLWKGTITNSDEEGVRTYQWKNGAPDALEWDGKNDAGEFVPDGVYSYRITSTDRAENTTTSEIDNIIKNTQETPVQVSIDTAYFSPNGDGIKDTVEFRLDVPVQQGITNWTVVLHNSRGTIVEQYSGTGEVPQTYSFNGKDKNGNLLEEDTYRATLDIVYQNGNNPVAESPPFHLDLTPPSAQVVEAYSIFSPNGDGRKDVNTFTISATREDFWYGRIVNANGDEIQTFRWAEQPVGKLEWDGRSEQGSIVEDGMYELILESTDRAGNRGSSNRVVFELSTIETPVRIAADTRAFSPNGDAVKDTIALNPRLEVESGIESWEIGIVSAEGRQVDSFSGATRIAPAYTWDGFTQAEQRAAEGEYRAELTVRYRNGNLSQAQSGPFLLDVTDPAATVDANYSIFSPNDDGNKDMITFTQETSTEQQWEGIIRNRQGSIVKQFSWQGKAPYQVNWDGRGDDKIMVDDGQYSYRVRATDLAGNSVTTSPLRFSIDTEKKPVFLSAEYNAFSPNNDGTKDTIQFLPQLKISEGIDFWELTVVDEDSNPVQSVSGRGAVDETLQWDGRNASGSRAAEAGYRAQLEVTYVNGNVSQASTAPFRLDVTKPQVTVTAEDEVFSPNGDNRKDTITFVQRTSEEDEWQGEIRDSDGDVIKQFRWQGEAPGELVWDGRTGEQTRAPDERYTYQLSSVDEAGNRGVSQAVTFRIDTRETPVFISTNRQFFSPNGDGNRDILTIIPEVKEEQGIESWTIELQDNENTTVKTYRGRAGKPSRLEWDGTGQEGTRLADGEYTVRFEVVYEHGNINRAEKEGIVLDTVAPRIDISTEYPIFSPNGDGRKDTITFYQSTSSEPLWKGVITDEEDTTVTSFIWKGKAETFAWDGTDERGNLVDDGSYTYRLTATDNAGNTSAATASVTLDNRYTYSFITVDKDGFSPNDDGNLDTITFSTTVGIKDGIESWSLELEHQHRGVQKSFSGYREAPPRRIEWDGKTEADSIVEGEYTARFTVTYVKGDRNFVETKPFLLDITAPRVDVGLQPTPFSPDNDGVDDELNIRLATDEAGAVEEWTLEIDDPRGQRFYTFAGTGTPAERLIWDGRSEENELVQSAEDYPYTLSIEDELGNSTTVSGIIPVDVLVVREDGKLKIRISSINFMPNSAELVTQQQDQELYSKNMRVLEMLAEKLQKYRRYDIRLEGHAVSVYWDDPQRAAREEEEELKPLSLARAKTVKQALVERGIAPGRMSTVGLGGTQPVVPHGDLENRWKNRRVEFILIK